MIGRFVLIMRLVLVIGLILAIAAFLWLMIQPEFFLTDDSKTKGVRRCIANLKYFGTQATLYSNEVSSGKYPPINSNIGDGTWGGYLRSLKYEGQVDFNIPKQLFLCPLRKDKINNNPNHYAWANPNHPVFSSGISADVPENTPIAGDSVKEAPGCAKTNHKETGWFGYKKKQANILLMNKMVRTVEPGSEIWKKAYEDGMLRCP